MVERKRICIRLGKGGKGGNPGENDNNKNKVFRKFKGQNRRFKRHIKALKRSNPDKYYDIEYNG